MPDLSGKTAVITGAGRGLGREIALALANQGASVALVARSAAQLAETAAAIQTRGHKAIAVPADVASIEAVDHLKQRVLAELGAPHVLVNAAGVFGPIQWIEDSDPRRWIETIEVNLIGPYLVCRAFLKHLIAHGWGRIVNVSSAASLHPPGPLVSAYATSKEALNRFTRNLAAELAGTGVTANVIHPGEVKSEMWATIARESKSAGPAGEPLRQWVEQVGSSGGDDPRRAVELVLDLLETKNDQLSGQFLWIDGGIQKPIPSW